MHNHNNTNMHTLKKIQKQKDGEKKLYIAESHTKKTTASNHKNKYDIHQSENMPPACYT